MSLLTGPNSGNTEASAAIGDLLEEVPSVRTEEADSALDALLKFNPANPTFPTLLQPTNFDATNTLPCRPRSEFHSCHFVDSMLLSKILRRVCTGRTGVVRSIAFSPLFLVISLRQTFQKELYVGAN
jgi:hypothetical protein